MEQSGLGIPTPLERSSFAIGRRGLVKGMAVTAALIGKAGACGEAPRHALAETTSGKVLGRLEDGVRVYRGIPYGGSTGGANRFLPPQTVEPWRGIRDAFAFGSSAPQLTESGSSREAFHRISPIGEDCLSLNVFTPTGQASENLPVMVWLHGGGWRIGGGSSPGLYGVRLARHGNVVLVTINHRLDLLGHLMIDDGDERFADAANNGVLDMIAALRWVQANIAAFGGNPANVTIFGQSGGGSKVAALLAAQSARGLFHKAIAQSCSGCLRVTEPAEAHAIASRVARNLGMPGLTGEALQQIPLGVLIMAVGGVHRPAFDGRTFSRHPFDPGAPPTSSGIPLMIGNVADETRMNMFAAGPAIFNLDADEVQRRLARYLRIDSAAAAGLLAAYHTDYPGETPSDLLAHVTADYSYVRNTRLMADRQAVVAPVYSYMFTRRSTARGGLLRSAHETEVPFVFGTASSAAAMVGTGPDIAPLEHMMMTTWSRFAWTGRPDNALLPLWDRHVPGSSSAMLLDLRSRMGALPGATARARLASLPIYEYGMPANFVRP